MANFTMRAPVNVEKPNELHDQSLKPGGKPVSRLQQFGPLAAALAGAAIFVALAFQVRAGWENHREWVVATTLPFAALGGVALGFVLWRGRIMEASPAILLLLLCTGLAALNYWRGIETTGQDGLRDALSIIEGVLLALAVVAAIGALIWVEWRHPYRAPGPAA